MTEFWDKIENWLHINHPSMIETLNQAASEEELTELESLTEVSLPKDFKDFLSIHNGQNWTHLNLFDGDRLLSTEEIFTEWKSWNEVLPQIDNDCREQYGERAMSTPDAGIKDDWWNSSWIPITSDGSGNNYCLDLSPTKEGNYGQVIRMWHDLPQRELIAVSFKEWISQYVEDLENGIYSVSSDQGFGGVIKNDL